MPQIKDTTGWVQGASLQDGAYVIIPYAMYMMKFQL